MDQFSALDLVLGPLPIMKAPKVTSYIFLGLDSILRGEIMRKDALIRQLMEQNKMLLMAKERQEVEMAAQGETLEVCLDQTSVAKPF